MRQLYKMQFRMVLFFNSKTGNKAHPGILMLEKMEQGDNKLETNLIYIKSKPKTKKERKHQQRR